MERKRNTISTKKEVGFRTEGGLLGPGRKGNLTGQTRSERSETEAEKYADTGRDSGGEMVGFGDGAQKATNLGSLQELKKARKWILPLEPPENTPLLHLDLSQWAPDLQKCQIINVHRFVVVSY